MGEAKGIEVKVIPGSMGNEFMRKTHYSGTVVNNSQVHFGVFLNERLHGVLSFGPPFDKKRVINLVKDTGWNEMLELNRMAFDEYLPRNSESRAISICIRLLKRNAPHVKWILSFSDATQSGDGTIYRAAGFHLTQIKPNRSIIRLKDGTVAASMTYTKSKHILKQNGRAGIPEGAEYLPGFQLRYIYLIDKSCQLNCEDIPFSKITEKGAGMYLGKKRNDSISNVPGFQPGDGVSNPPHRSNLN